MNEKMLAVVLLAGACLVNGPKILAQATSSKQPAANSWQASVDQDIKLLRQDIASQKKRLIAANLSLTETEATKF